jgi:multidrug efflux pump
MTFFIYRPVFAWVIAIIIMLAGLFSINTLPVSQYPNVAPPTIGVSAKYPGADAETIENSVTQIIEQSLTGLDGLLYFNSTSSSDGSVRISVTFSQNTNPDTAQIQVQNKVQQALSRLPLQVQEQGVTINKSQSDFLLIAALYDKTNKLSSSDLSDYLISNIQDPLSRIEGVGDIRVFGAQYAMRIWIDPIKLSSKNITTNEIVAAIKEQNAEISAGKIGAQPASQYQQITATVKAQSKFKTVNEFENIIIKNNNGAKVLLKDVARVELGQENYGASPKLNGHPASGVAVMLAPNANALDTSDRVKELFSKYERSLPDGVEIAFPKDSTDFIKLSINEVVKTLFEAIILVVLIMFLFLQNIRATIIPTITIPVVLLGTFGVLAAFGFSINTLTLFALVLSIGLLVDDSIVVVENIERIMKEEGLNAKEATIKSMQDISGALIGIATVLSAVFLPMAFFDGSSGIIYKQFSITIITSMLLSVLVALVLTPAICATFLKNTDHKETGFFGWFNHKYDNLQNKYKSKIEFISKRPVRFFLIYLIICLGLIFVFGKLPKGFIPKEDQGEVMVQYTLPAGATINRTDVVGEIVRKHFMEFEAKNTKYIFTISGFNFSGSAQNAGMAFVALKDWSEREGKENTADAVAGRAMGMLSTIKDASVFALTRPSISGLGQSAGFTLYLQGIGSREELKKSRDLLIAEASKNSKLIGVRVNELKEMPKLKINIDIEKAKALGVSISAVNETLNNSWGGTYVNDFIDRGRVKKVYVQGDMEYRALPEDLRHWYVRNNQGTLTPLIAFAEYSWEVGPETLGRYNGLPSYEIQGQGSNGISSGQAMDEIEGILKNLPKNTVYSWSGLSYQEKLSQGKSTLLYSVSILVVFLCLAALYESWKVPLSVILVIPLGVIGAVLSAYFRGLENDVYFQVALLTTIGLAAKNAILIVEFAELYVAKGKSIYEAAILASVARLRPIIMTSFAFIAGVMPLALATGAGANSRLSIGTGIVGGTLTATLLAIFFVPLFFIIVKSIFKDKKGELNAE